MNWKRVISIFFMIILLQNVVWAQKIIQGTVRNKTTREPLANTNIQIVGTYRGTISNEEGKYILEVDNFPATILFTYIGYKSEKILIKNDSPQEQNIYLQSIAIKMKPIIFTGEDPAVSIMREVIDRKKKWRKKLKTYIADSYSRLVAENDTSIACILESTSKVYWDKEKGLREVIQSKNSTSNIPSTLNLAAASYQPNFYDDNIELQGAEFIGPTHPEALKYYTFHLENEKVINDKTIFDISVTPKTRLNPAFMGNIQVLDREFAMIGIDLKPSEAFKLPVPIKEFDFSCEQQFSNYGKDFWLPVDVRIEGKIKIGMIGFEMPVIKYKQISRMADYSINGSLPDSLFENDRASIMDSPRIRADSLVVADIDKIPLTDFEKDAYSTIDSTMTLDKAFKPSGFLAKYATVSVVSEHDTTEISGKEKSSSGMLSRINPQFRFNRVDGLHMGLKVNQPINNVLELSFLGAYKTAMKKWAFQAGLKYNFAKNFLLTFSYKDDTFPQNESNTYPLLINSLNTLLGYNDYFNYFWNQSWETDIEYYFRKINISVSLGFKNEKHTSVEKNTDFNLLGRDVDQADNPEINKGQLRDVDFTIKFGGASIPWGIIPQHQVAITVEHSSPDLLGSDFSFTSCHLRADTYFETFYRRRVLPSTFYCKLDAFGSSGDIPVQSIRIADVRMAGFTPYGVFKTLGSRTFTCGNFISLYWEHNFRTIPFEIFGLKGLSNSGIEIILYGANGKFWKGESQFLPGSSNHIYLNDVQSEIGFSINKIFNFFRVDFSKNLNRDDYFIGLSVARVF